MATKMELMRTPGYQNPEMVKLIEKNGRPAALGEDTDIHKLRELLLEKKRAMTAAGAPSASSSSVTEKDHQVPTRDGSHITVREYKGPDSANGPVMIVLHGGGWVLGGLENEALLCRRWASEFGGVTLNVDYRLAPEFKFPIPVNDAWDSIKWAAENASVYGGDPTKSFIVAGISAGANMAVTCSHLAKDEGLTPKLSGVYLSIPSTLAPQAVPDKWKSEYKSREENSNAPILGASSLALFRKHYQDDPLSPLMSPAIWPSGHSDIPPTYFQVAGMDPLRDEGLIYEKMLREESGVPTRLDVYPGLPHGFSSWWPSADFSQASQNDSREGMRWLLEQSQAK